MRETKQAGHDAVAGPVEPTVRPVFEHGFWWWFDPRRGGWFVGTAPQIQKPTWAA